MGEAFITRRGGGSAGLNFRVIGDTIAPGSPKENDIWVNTDRNISEWCFSSDDPLYFGSESAQDMVWITTGTSSTVAFDALKKNGIQVYPLYAKQYVSGAWVDKTAKSWQGGKWVEWISDLVIFEAGKGSVQAASTKKGGGTITVSTSKITFSGDDVVYYTTSKINTAGYKTLRLTGKFTEINSDADLTGFGLKSSVPVADNFSAQSGWVSSKEIESANSSSKVYDCPISGSGSYYFVFAGAQCGGEITDIRLIP